VKRHLKDRELIEYRFELTSKAGVKRIADHLRQCPLCRDKLQQLDHKLSALDLLREEVQLSPDLIRQIADQAAQPAPVKARIFSFGKPAWIGLAAAMLVFVALLAVSVNYFTPKTLQRGKGPSPPGYVEKTTRRAKAPTAIPITEVSKGGRMTGKAGAAKVAIPEQPPFAPASAIELVVLPKRDSVQLTIYNSADLTLVRERRNLTLKRGWNWLQFAWANTLIDPTSLHLEPLEKKDQINIRQLVFPSRLGEIGRWLIRSEATGRVPFEITYFTTGITWRAFYMGTLSQDEKLMSLKGYVRVDNRSGEDYENAQTRLIVGQVHLLDQIAELARRKYPYGRPGGLVPVDVAEGGSTPLLKLNMNGLLRRGRGMGMYGGGGGEYYALKPKEIKKEALSEYFLYTIEGTETVPDKWGKRLQSFEKADIKVKGLYKYDEQRWGKKTIRYLAFANDEKHNLGDTPIPNGQVRIYGQADSEEHLSYVGQTGIKYIPVNEEIELNLGPARLVTVEPTMMNFQTDNYVFDKEDKKIIGWDEIRTWKIKVTNTRTLPVDIEITRGFESAYWTLQADIPYKKYDVTRARFKLIIEPRTKQTFTYTVTTYYGVRQEKITQ